MIDLTDFGIYPRFFVVAEEERLDGHGDSEGVGYSDGDGYGDSCGDGYGDGYSDSDGYSNGNGFDGDICDLYTPSDMPLQTR